MPPPAILDPAQLDFENIVADRDEILRINPHRFEFQLVDRMIYLDEATRTFAGYHDIATDAWWVRGHIPGRPLFPGVLMIECAAQICSLASHRCFKSGGFLGFAAADEVKFRGIVEPPNRFVVVGHAPKMTPRRTVSNVQGFVNGALVFEASIIGMTV